MKLSIGVHIFMGEIGPIGFGATYVPVKFGYFVKLFPVNI